MSRARPQVRRQQVLAPVVVEVAPDRVDVVGAVLRVVVLDDEASARGPRSSGRGPERRIRPRRTSRRRGRRRRSAPTPRRRPPAARARRSAGSGVRGPPGAARRGPHAGSRPGRTAGPRAAGPGEDVGRRDVVDHGHAALRRRQLREQRARELLLARQRPLARRGPLGIDRRVRPEERRRRADHAIVGDRHVDRDMVAADAPRPRRRRPASPKTANQYSSGSRRIQPARPPARSSSPRTVSSAMIARDLAGGPRAHRRRRRSPLDAARWSGRMSRIARPSPRAGRVRPDEALRRLERERRLGALGVVQAGQPGADRGRDLPGRRASSRACATPRAADSRSRIARLTPSIGTRSWVIESRSRTVTAPSSSDSTSTRHAPRRADLVLAPVELADRGRVVVDGHHVASRGRRGACGTARRSPAAS